MTTIPFLEHSHLDLLRCNTYIFSLFNEMDHDKISQSISDLHKAIKSGEENEMRSKAGLKAEIWRRRDEIFFRKRKE